MNKAITRNSLSVSLLLLPALALAHTEAGVTGGLLSGFTHPLFGLDHMLAMVAVGIWGAQLGNPALWLLPVAFPLVMALGGVVGGLGLVLPAVETGIAASVLVLGLMVALVVRPPLALALVIVAVFAVFHGYAHGVELPAAADPFAYGIGFVVATGLLHAVGIAIGLLLHWPFGDQVLRGSGAAIAVGGLYFIAAPLIG